MKKVSSLFCDGLPGFHCAVSSFSNVLAYHGPTDLVHKLSELNVYPLLLSSWFHSLFTYPSLSDAVGTVGRIWDVFIAEQMDFVVLLKVAYLIVIRHKETLIGMDFV